MYPQFGLKTQSYGIDSLSGGIIIDAKETDIGINCSPDMLNMIYDGSVLRKREGQKLIFAEDDIKACFKQSYYNYIIYHAGDKIKAYNPDTGESTMLIGQISEDAGEFFTYNGHVYYIGTGDYFKITFEDESLSCQRVEGYIPTVLINCENDGTGDEYEPFNFLSGGFKLTYNTSVSYVYKIPYEDIDTEKGVKVVLNGVERTKGFTFEDGQIIFDDAPGEGHNNLEVTAYIKNSNTDEDRRKIVNCTAVETFGGLSAGISEGTRVFISGNREYANTFFYSELKNPEYFPVTQFEILGDVLDPVICMGKQYNGLIFFKENSIYISYYTYENGEVNFTVSQLNNGVGCDCKNTLVTLDNQLVWLNSRHGVMTLSSTNIKDEKNIKCISDNINGISSLKALLNQENLTAAIGFVHRGGYYIVTEKYTYMLNTERGFYINNDAENMSWFLFDNISAKDYVNVNREVYLAGDKGLTCFDKVLYDFTMECPINSYVRTKAIDFDMPGYFKYIYDISFNMKAINNSAFTVEFADENGRLEKSFDHTLSKFNFVNFAFNRLTFKGNQFSYFVRRRVQRRRTKFFMITFENKLSNSQMAISDIYINYSIERGARFNGI